MCGLSLINLDAPRRVNSRAIGPGCVDNPPARGHARTGHSQPRQTQVPTRRAAKTCYFQHLLSITPPRKPGRTLSTRQAPCASRFARCHRHRRLVIREHSASQSHRGLARTAGCFGRSKGTLASLRQRWMCARLICRVNQLAVSLLIELGRWWSLDPTQLASKDE